MNARRSTLWFSCQAKVLAPALVRRLTGILTSFGVEIHFLKGTRDVFCRDYMPVCVGTHRRVQFLFDPRYFKSKNMRRFRTDTGKVTRQNGIFIHNHSNIVLDGGNVVQGFGRAILTDRIFEDNPAIPSAQLVGQLEKLLKAEVIVIPSFPGEITGHADGLIRFLSPNRVMIHTRKGNDTRWHDRLVAVLKKWKISTVEIPFIDTASGIEGLHINYLDLPECVIVPGIGKRMDKEIMALFGEWFRPRPVFLVDGRAIMRHGGAFNCMTWNG